MQRKTKTFVYVFFFIFVTFLFALPDTGLIRDVRMMYKCTFTSLAVRVHVGQRYCYIIVF